MVRRPLILTLVLLGSLVGSLLGSIQPVFGRIDRGVRDRVVPAAVQLAIDAEWVERDFRWPFPIPLGSGTIVTPDGLVLTNAHVVDPASSSEAVRDIEKVLRKRAPHMTLDYRHGSFLVFTSDGVKRPRPTYLAEVVQADEDLDLAVLRIAHMADGSQLAPRAAFPFIPLGDSDALGLGDPIHVFGYPAIGGDALTYTVGVVSGFVHEDRDDRPDWITTDAVMSGGSSGGTAVDDRGALVGIPTQGSELDCRPGDTNHDGAITAADVGCIPTGGAIGEMRPANFARPLIAAASVARQSAPVSPTPVIRRTGADEALLPLPPDPDLPGLAFFPTDLAVLGLRIIARSSPQYWDSLAGSPRHLLSTCL
ncbi:MAG: trypsin-like peptidase domain-containing protein [Thermomicrobiales bacterium]|nr:trypsin-like peptidase domain-containing protein [Thermomicrobiales bacterium]